MQVQHLHHFWMLTQQSPQMVGNVTYHSLLWDKMPDPSTHYDFNALTVLALRYIVLFHYVTLFWLLITCNLVPYIGQWVKKRGNFHFDHILILAKHLNFIRLNSNIPQQTNILIDKNLRI